MKKRSSKYQNHLLKKARAELRRRGRKGKSSSNYKPPKSIGPVRRIKFIDIKTPKIFRLQPDTCEPVIEFINKIKKLGSSGRHVNIIMDDITEIGEGAIAMLLSVMEELVKKGIIFKGSKPRNQKAKEILEQSGFFKFVKGRVENDKESKNNILRTGDHKTSQSELVTEIVKAMDTIWGKKGRSPSVYSTVIEMMRNACDHAFKWESQIKWHFALSHSDEENQVKFSFVDNGKGIVKTLQSDKLFKRILGLFKDSMDIVESAFSGDIESRTGLNWRGKGLPTIYENYKDNYLRNLVVISNDVYIDFENNIKIKLKNSFSGTYYFWVVDRTCKKECFKI